MAIKNPTANQPGGLNTLIGVDPGSVHSAVPINLALNTAVVATFIGGATVGVEDPRYAGKALRYQQAAGAVADGVAVANTYLNHTGKALKSGDVVLAAAP